MIFTKTNKASVYKGYKQDKIEMRGDRAEMSDFVVKIYALPVVEIPGSV